MKEKYTTSSPNMNTKPNIPKGMLDGVTVTFASLIKEKLKAINGLISRNAGRGVIRYLWLVADVLRVHRTASDSKMLVGFAKVLFRIHNSEGMRGLVLHLKTAHVLLQQGTGRYRVEDLGPLKRRIKRTDSGLPRIIPAWQRTLIRSGDVHAIRFWASLFGIYRILEFKGVVSTSTITDKGVEIPQSFVVAWADYVSKVFWPAILSQAGEKVVSALRKRRMEPRPFAIQKAGSTSSFTDGLHSVNTFGSSSLSALAVAADHFSHSEHLKGVLRSYLQILGFTNFAGRMNWTLRNLRSAVEWSSAHCLGKLGIKEEAAGKMRVFAMVDAWTQWVLRPVHDFLFDLLRNIPQDGTFNQPAPAERLVATLQAMKAKNLPVWVYSIDLSAATDRLPVSLQTKLISEVFATVANGYYRAEAPKLAELWRALLVDRGYYLKYNLISKVMPRVTYTSNHIPVIWGRKTIKKTVVETILHYAVGQPMGALSSWASLAITHHAIVQFAAYRAKRVTMSKPWFTLYAILGDDIVIGDRKVALEYLNILKTIGVGAGLAKSLVSRGQIVLEFAKKFWTPERADAVTFRELVAARLSIRLALPLVAKYQLTWEQFVRFYYSGKGHKVVTKGDSPLWDLPNRLRIPYIWLKMPGNPWAGTTASGQPFLSYAMWILRYSRNESWTKVSRQTLDQILRNVKSTAFLLDKAYTKRVLEIHEKNKSAPVTMGGFPESAENPSLIMQGLALYNKVDPDMNVETGVDPDRVTKVDRMLSNANEWNAEAFPELLSPEWAPKPEASQEWSSADYIKSGFHDSWEPKRWPGYNTLQRLESHQRNDIFRKIHYMVVCVKNIDEALGSLNERAPQHRVDDSEKTFSDMVTWYTRWVEWSRPVWVDPRASTRLGQKGGRINPTNVPKEEQKPIPKRPKKVKSAGHADTRQKREFFRKKFFTSLWMLDRDELQVRLSLCTALGVTFGFILANLVGVDALWGVIPQSLLPNHLDSRPWTWAEEAVPKLDQIWIDFRCFHPRGSGVCLPITDLVSEPTPTFELGWWLLGAFLFFGGWFLVAHYLSQRQGEMGLREILDLEPNRINPEHLFYLPKGETSSEVYYPPGIWNEFIPVEHGRPLLDAITPGIEVSSVRVWESFPYYYDAYHNITSFLWRTRDPVLNLNPDLVWAPHMVPYRWLVESLPNPPAWTEVLAYGDRVWPTITSLIF